MKIYELGKDLALVESLPADATAICVATPSEAGHLLKSHNMLRTESHELSRITLCKAEVHHEYWECTLCIPDRKRPKDKHRIQYYIQPGFLLFVDDSSYTNNIIEKIKENLTDQGQTLERFLYDFFRIVLDADMVQLEKREADIMDLEDAVIADKASDFQKKHTEMRKDLLTLRAYYEGLGDMASELQENDNAFFDENNLNYFEIIAARSERLMNKTARLLEYLSEIRETNLEMINDKQNRNMNYLTVISTIFLPLTLITGWFGMNFYGMPGLENGYYFTVAGCIAIVLIVILILKKKKFLS